MEAGSTIGHFRLIRKLGAGGEALGLRTIVKTLLVLISVVVITTARGEKPVNA